MGRLPTREVVPHPRAAYGGENHSEKGPSPTTPTTLTTLMQVGTHTHPGESGPCRGMVTVSGREGEAHCVRQGSASTLEDPSKRSWDISEAPGVERELSPDSPSLTAPWCQEDNGEGRSGPIASQGRITTHEMLGGPWSTPLSLHTSSPSPPSLQHHDGVQL